MMIFTACAMAFAHGSNDVANGIGPLAAVVSIVQSGGEVAQKAELPLWILVLGGFGIVVGLATMGYKVMQTIGTRITELTPSAATARRWRPRQRWCWRHARACRFRLPTSLSAPSWGRSGTRYRGYRYSRYWGYCDVLDRYTANRWCARCADFLHLEGNIYLSRASGSHNMTYLAYPRRIPATTITTGRR